MKKKTFILPPVVFFIAGCIFAFLVNERPVGYQNDVITYNRIAKETAKYWMCWEDAKFPQLDSPFSVVAPDGAILYQSATDAVTSVAEALANGNPILDVEDSGNIIGKVLISKNPGEQMLRYRETVIRFILCFTLFSSLASGSYFYYLEYKILRPFRELNQFADQVSQGNLNFTLKRKKNNLFGAFTESFDRMREQLELAREKEGKANRNQKELVAALSHDLKTPVTSIRLTSELLLELEQNESLRVKIGMIYQKTEQIEELVNNLFHTTLQDMEQLTVSPVEVYSSALERMIRNADDRGKVTMEPLPECMLFLDELRFTQVLSNLFYNSYKYADTVIQIETCVKHKHLILSIRDFGPGVSEEELPLLCKKFYRGSNAATENGSGLGLYLCKKLMEQMQGEVYCTCSKEGFTVVLSIKLI